MTAARVADDAWLWMVDEIAVRVRRGQRVPDAVFDAAGGGPRRLRDAAAAARRSWMTGGDPAVALDTFGTACGDGRLRRLVATLAAADAVDADPDPVLRRLRALVADDLERARQVRHARAQVWIGAVAAVAPLAAVAAGWLTGAAAVLVAVAAGVAVIASLPWRRPRVVRRS